MLTSSLMKAALNRAKRRRSGYTLIEIMVTIAIIGSLASVAVISISKMIPMWRLEQAQSQVFSDFRKARVSAVSRSREVTITIDAAAESYTIATGTDSETKSIANIEGVSMSTSATELKFAASGRLASPLNAVHTVTLSAEGLPAMEIRTLPTGQVDLVR